MTTKSRCVTSWFQRACRRMPPSTRTRGSSLSTLARRISLARSSSTSARAKSRLLGRAGDNRNARRRRTLHALTDRAQADSQPLDARAADDRLLAGRKPHERLVAAVVVVRPEEQRRLLAVHAARLLAEPL